MRRLNDIQLQRGMLLERTTTQRYFLSAETQPVQAALNRIDVARTYINTGIRYVKRYPLLAGLAVATLTILNGRRVFRLARRSFFVWETWRTLRQRFPYL